MKKLSIIALSFYLLTGGSSSAKQYPGCNCASVTACEVAACAALGVFGLACIGQGAREDMICLCKIGAMAHCDNWYTDLENCNADTKAAVTSDPKCNPSYLKEKYGEKVYQGVLDYTRKALKEGKSK